MSAPDGRDYDVRRQWLPWRQRIPLDTELVVTLLAAVELALRVVLAPLAVLLRMLRIVPWTIEVRDLGARRGRTVVSREGVRGWGPSKARIQVLARDLASGRAEADGPDFSVVIARDSVAAGDDVADNTTVLTLTTARPSPPSARS